MLYLKDVTEVLQKQAVFGGNHEITFYPGRINALQRATSASTFKYYIGKNYREGMKKMIGSSNSGDV